MPHSILKVAKRIQISKGKPMKQIEGIEIIKKAKLNGYKELKK